MIALIRETIDRLLYRIPERPRQIQIEITNRCNMDCPMCPREVMDIELEHMDWDKFTTVVDQLTNREDITLTGWGEPFLYPSIFDMVAYCKERGHRVMITSNGLFSKTSLVDEILKADPTTLTFSIDSIKGTLEYGHTSTKVLENLEAIAKGRKNGSPALRLQATLHADSEEDLYDVIRFAGKTGFEVVNIGRIDRKYDKSLKRPGPLEEARIFAEADRIANEEGVQLDWLQYSVSHGLTKLAYRLLKKKLHRSGRYCLKTFDYAYVTREGNVTPCCLLPEAKMGSMLDSGLKGIWQNSRFNHFRENYRDTCGKCDLWTIDQVDLPEEEKSPEENLVSQP
jgi:MoaA/NifB/PqqE/SkfB family radical SAM enzyme